MTRDLLSSERRVLAANNCRGWLSTSRQRKPRRWCAQGGACSLPVLSGRRPRARLFIVRLTSARRGSWSNRFFGYVSPPNCDTLVRTWKTTTVCRSLLILWIVCCLGCALDAAEPFTIRSTGAVVH